MYSVFAFSLQRQTQSQLPESVARNPLPPQLPFVASMTVSFEVEIVTTVSWQMWAGLSQGLPSQSGFFVPTQFLAAYAALAFVLAASSVHPSSVGPSSVGWTTKCPPCLQHRSSSISRCVCDESFICGVVVF